ncbi:hypothetical protein [Streptomyces sp. NBC_00847]|uniref:hypothetical protein n=1 Tax=Streptomyces sp. NBC_00847 TaxID=2975850 RepID=UPI00225E672B|nr:hypothetical protein [Streptomyces sp. NBC_00847]MCX4885993.1 hypothetical protein [Streptomyces sp. NBC_00847]
MQINGAERGHVLLIAGDRAVHRRTVQVHPSANLAALSVVPVPVLLNSTLPADLVHLDGVRDQNTLLLRLRTAAATPGPLLVYLSGRLTVDRKGRRLHLASTGTNASTTRYTALPWEWVVTELRNRPAGWTTLLLDLVADKAAWIELQELGTLPAVNADTYGVVSPPGFPGADGASPYTRQIVEQLRRNPDRPAAPRLHALTVAAAGIPPGALVLPAAPQIEAYDDEEEQPAPRPPMSNLQRLLTGDTSVLPARRRRPEPQEFAPGLTAIQPAPAPEPAPTAPYAYPSPAPVQVPQPPAPVEHPAPAPVRQQPYVPPQSPAPTHVRPAQPTHQQRQEPVRAPHPSPSPVARQAPVQQPPAPAPTPQPAPVHQQVQAPQQDPRPYIWQTAQAGRHNEAAEMASAWEQHALQRFGPDSPQATQWAEIRADLARIAGRWTFATQLWIAATHTRLAHQAPDSTEVLNGAKSAHYCWTEIKDPAEARDCGPELVNLLRQLPALDRRHLTTAQQRLEYLQNAPTSR